MRIPQSRGNITGGRGLIGRILLAGSLPYSTLFILCGVAFWAGRTTMHPPDKVATVEKGAIVLEAVLAHPEASRAQLEAQVGRPILQVLERYAQQGYTVIDISRDEHGGMNVAAIPDGAIDITAEMRQAVKSAHAEYEEPPRE